MTERLGLGLGVSSDLGDTKSSNNFVSTWTTTGGNLNVELPLIDGGTYNFTVNWGDDNTGTVTAYDDASASHTYASATTYTITITGTITGFKFNNDHADRTLITTITNWGTLNLSSDGSFHGCSNLNVSASDRPTISTLDLGETFKGCAKLTSIGKVWDTSSVTDFTQMFRGCTKYNEDIGSMAVLAATTFNKMFYNCTVFNQDISSWTTDSVTIMTYMFYNAEAFNQDIGSEWETGEVTNMVGMFQGAAAFNQDMSDFDIAKLADAENMFYGANALSTDNYELLLIGWEAQSEVADVKFHGGDAVVTDGTAITARTNLRSSGWVITDGDS